MASRARTSGDVGRTEDRVAGHRSATVSLPFVTAQVRLPHLRLPGRDDLTAAAQDVRRQLPSRKALLFFGGLTATAVLGAIEWPVAAAIGVGSALASRGDADPRPGVDEAGAPEAG